MRASETHHGRAAGVGEGGVGAAAADRGAVVDEPLRVVVVKGVGLEEPHKVPERLEGAAEHVRGVGEAAQGSEERADGGAHRGLERGLLVLEQVDEVRRHDAAAGDLQVSAGGVVGHLRDDGVELACEEVAAKRLADGVALAERVRDEAEAGEGPGLAGVRAEGADESAEAVGADEVGVGGGGQVNEEAGEQGEGCDDLWLLCHAGRKQQAQKQQERSTGAKQPDLARRHGGVAGRGAMGIFEDEDEGLDGAGAGGLGEEDFAAEVPVDHIAGEGSVEPLVEEEADRVAGDGDEGVLVAGRVDGAEPVEEADEELEAAGLAHGDVRVVGPAVDV